MLPEFTLIIHGWSASSADFINLKEYLMRAGIGDVNSIVYADYESREDNITFGDIIHGLNDQLIKYGFIDENGKKLCNLNVIVHSTGGLVIRHWIWRYYKDKINDCPIKRLIMLAPANFGSPLAHRGKSFIGALMKGRREADNFAEVGRQILDGLELGSQYQWDMAHRDLITKKPYFHSRQIQTSVFVGAEAYSGITGLFNKPGTDGTVVIAGCNLNSAKLTLDFSKPKNKSYQYTPYDWQYEDPPADFAFAVLPGLNHDSIIGQTDAIGPLIVEAIQTKQFKKFQNKLSRITENTYNTASKAKYQQFLLRAIDDQGVPVSDYTIQFFICKSSKNKANRTVQPERPFSLSAEEEELSKIAHSLLSQEFHTYSKDSSFRRFLVNPQLMTELLEQARKKLTSEVALCMKLYIPEIDRGIRYNTDNLQNIILYHTAMAEERGLSFFYDNTTTLVEMKVSRCNTYVTISPNPRKH